MCVVDLCVEPTLNGSLNLSAYPGVYKQTHSVYSMSTNMRIPIKQVDSINTACSSDLNTTIQAQIKQASTNNNSVTILHSIGYKTTHFGCLKIIIHSGVLTSGYWLVPVVKSYTLVPVLYIMILFITIVCSAEYSVYIEYIRHKI